MQVEKFVGVAVDWDNVIVDTGAGFEAAQRQIAAEFGVIYDLEMHERWRDMQRAPGVSSIRHIYCFGCTTRQWR